MKALDTDMREHILAREALLVADAARDELETLVREHARLVYQVAYSVLRNRQDAEDALQETFVRVLRHRRKLPAVRDRRAWLARIAWRVALDGRSQRREVSLEDVTGRVRDHWEAGADVERQAGEEQMMLLLERLIATLPPELREALVLSTVEGMTSGEIAAVLDLPEASVRTRLFRARQLLREKLSGVLGGRHGR